MAGKRPVIPASPIGRFLIILLLLMAWPTNGQAWFWQEKPLAAINGQEFSADDFLEWWQHWREEGMAFPETPAPFIEWQLLAQEARSMGLEEDPAYRNKVETFLKVRSLLLLKRDEVADRIVLDDAAIHADYLTRYVPSRKVDILYFPDAGTAGAARSKIDKGTLSMEQLIALSHPEGGPLQTASQWYRPIALSRTWNQVLASLKPGDISQPFPYEGHTVFCRLLVEKEASQADYEQMKETVKHRLGKTLQNRYTNELVERLKKKFQVTVDWDLLERLSLSSPAPSLMALPLIRMQDQDIPVSMFLGSSRNETEFRQKYGFTVGTEAEIKKRAVAGIISQTIISREAIERNYQEEEELRSAYNFYCGHRLVIELGNRIFTPAARVSPQEIETYKRQNPISMTMPETVIIATLKEDKKLLEKIWQEVLLGEEFMTAAGRYFTSSLKLTPHAVDSLSPFLRQTLDGLAKGEVSQPMAADDTFMMVYLHDHIQEKSVTVHNDVEEIRRTLSRQKIEQQRAEFVAKLKQNSTIQIHDRIWNKIRQENGNNE